MKYSEHLAVHRTTLLGYVLAVSTIIVGCAHSHRTCIDDTNRLRLGTNIVHELDMYLKELDILQRARDQAKAIVEKRLLLMNEHDKSIFQNATKAREDVLTTKEFQTDFCRFKIASEKSLRAIEAETKVYRKFLSVDLE
jgi:hypothetical protein